MKTIHAFAALPLLLLACGDDPNSTTGTGGAGGAGGEGGQGAGGGINVVNPDPCDPFAQNCVVEGVDKCALVFEGDDASTGSFTCVETLGEGQPGESCERPTGVAGEDTCAGSSYCAYWGLPQGTPQERVCRELCTVAEPCGDSAMVCDLMSVELAVGTCNPTCTPFGDECLAGTKCGHERLVDGSYGWVCSFEGARTAGETCDASEDCAPGHSCFGTATTGRCERICDAENLCPGDSGCVESPELEGVGFCTPADWSCVGNPLVPPVTASSSTVTLRVFEFTETGNFVPIAGAAARACAAADSDCATPIDSGVTDSDGFTDLVVPLGATGFEGYFDATGPAGQLGLLFGFPAIVGPTAAVDMAITSPAALTAQGVPTDPTRGTVLTNLGDCSDEHTSPGVALASSAADAMTIVGYRPFGGGPPNFDLPVTSWEGDAAIALHPAGPATVTFTATEAGLVASVDAIVRAGAVTFMAPERPNL